jgi:C4-dicarboxylate-specific signal transduction histidine kinase
MLQSGKLGMPLVLVVKKVREESNACLDELAMNRLTPTLLLDQLDRRQSLWLVTTLMVGVAMADYATGYEIRLSILYLVPIAMATWTAGLAMGIVVAVLSSLFWLFSFRTNHLYLHQGYYFWEAAVLLFGFIALAWVVARLRRALSQADERFFRLLEGMQAAVVVCDERDEQVLYANPAMARIAGETQSWTSGVLKRRFDEVGIGFGRPNSVPSGFSSRTVRDPASGAWYLLQRGSIPWGTNPAVSLNVLTDISEQKNAEVFREKHLDDLNQSARLTTLAEIATTLAHEINQPLMVIATYTDACQRLLGCATPDLAEIANALQKCHAQAVRAASIIERLREFIRQRHYHPVQCDARALALEALDFMRSWLDDGHIRVDTTRLDAGLSVLADRPLLIQALSNLIRNAIDAMGEMPPESRRLSVAVARETTGEIRFSITDTGPGIQADTAEQIFTPFFTTHEQGLGLGLAICRTVVGAHGGRLWAENAVDGGACFVLTIPASAVLS